MCIEYMQSQLYCKYNMSLSGGHTSTTTFDIGIGDFDCWGFLCMQGVIIINEIRANQNSPTS